MEIRTRQGLSLGQREDLPIDSSSFTGGHYTENISTSKLLWRRIKRECHFTSFTIMNIFRGRASKITYLLIPVLLTLFWLFICILTTSNRTLSIEQRILESRKEYEAYQKKHSLTYPIETVLELELPPDGSVHIAVAMPYLDVNPLAAQG